MIKFIKKNKLKFISYFLCAFAMALFTFISFSCKTYAYTIDSNGNLVGDNLFNINNYGFRYDTNNDRFYYLNINQIDTYTISATKTPIRFEIYGISNNGNVGYELLTIATQSDFNNPILTFNIPSDFDFNTYKIVAFISTNTGIFNSDLTYFYIMLNKGNEALSWEPYGVWYSETNYETINNLYDNALSQYNDLALGNNYGYWKYIDYVEFYVDNSNIFVPNTQEQNEWEISDLYNNNILKVGGYFDTFPLTMEPYQSNYNQVISYINFNSYTPSDSLIISFNNCDGCNVVINDDKSNSFTTIISETNYLIDINKIRESVPSFSLYVIEMYITPNNAEQNGVYFANNDYITAYNKGYNVATSNADRKYIPQITDLQNQINSLNNNITDLSNNIDTLRALNNDLQNQINNSYSWQNLFFAFADTPFRVVSNVLGFELFGLNLFATFIGMITVFGVVYLLKKFL